MKTYKIVLKAAGAITQLPDSQKVFGALVTMFAKASGNEKATELVKAVLEKRIHLALSNVLPLEYLPVPQDYIVDKLAESLSKDGNLKEKRSEVKERSYIKPEDLTYVMENPEKCSDIYPYIKQSDEQQLRASIDSVTYGVEGLETKLYTVPVLRLQEIKTRKEEAVPVSDFCFYLQSGENELAKSVLILIEELIRSGTSLILGKRASQGLNKYRVVDMEQIELPDAEYYLNLGMLLPDKIDFESSTLKLFTSERRPFSMPGGWNQHSGKYFISFIDIGSVVYLQKGVEQAGKSVRSPFNKNRDIVFGNALLYPISCGKEGEK